MFILCGSAPLWPAGVVSLGYSFWVVKRRDRQLGADDRLQTGLAGGLMKPGSTVHAIGVEQRQRRIPERRGTLDERFGQRGALQKTERGGAMELDVHG